MILAPLNKSRIFHLNSLPSVFEYNLGLGTMAISQGWKRGARRVKSVCFGWRAEPAPPLALSHVSWEESGFLEAHVTFQSRVPTWWVFSLSALHKVNGHHRRPQFPSYSHAGCAGG